MLICSKTGYISVLVTLALQLAVTSPITNSRSKVAGLIHRIRSPSSEHRQWYNTSQPPSDPQIFCHNESQTPIYTAGDKDLGGPGVMIRNFDPDSHGNVNGTMYFLYESAHDFVPYKYLTIAPWSNAFVAVCATFRGRIVRGDPTNLDGQKHVLGTWAEINWHANGSGCAWGDISLLQGNDGAATIQSLDGLSRMRGFTLDLLSDAPDGAWARKATGSWCLDKITGADANNVTREWESRFLDPWNVYLEDDKDPVINSVNGRFQVTFYKGIV